MRTSPPSGWRTANCPRPPAPQGRGVVPRIGRKSRGSVRGMRPSSPVLFLLCPSCHVSRSAGTASRPQLEHDEAFILQEAAEAGAKVLLQPGVVLEPPKRLPPEHHEVRPR